MNQRISPAVMFAGVMIIIFSLLLAGSKAFAGDDEALWLARSCIGEAGWNAYSTGECAAIWHVYSKRGEINGKGTLWTARKYSSAIKRGSHQRNKWVMHLNGTERPRKWPRNLNWSKYRERWIKTLSHAKDFVSGVVADPLPVAVHYGSRIDRHRAKNNWRIVDAPFRNLYWRVI